MPFDVSHSFRMTADHRHNAIGHASIASVIRPALLPRLRGASSSPPDQPCAGISVICVTPPDTANFIASPAEILVSGRTLSSRTMNTLPVIA